MERAGDEDVEVGRERLKEREGMERRKNRGEKGVGTRKRKLDLRSSRQIDATELDNALSQLTFETNHSVVLCPHRILFCQIYGTKINSITQLLTIYGSDFFLSNINREIFVLTVQSVPLLNIYICIFRLVTLGLRLQYFTK
jgi:hypothetical protein